MDYNIKVTKIPAFREHTALNELPKSHCPGHQVEFELEMDHCLSLGYYQARSRLGTTIALAGANTNPISARAGGHTSPTATRKKVATAAGAASYHTLHRDGDWSMGLSSTWIYATRARDGNKEQGVGF